MSNPLDDTQINHYTKTWHYILVVLHNVNNDATMRLTKLGWLG